MAGSLLVREVAAAARGDEAIGWVDPLSSQAEHAEISEQRTKRKPIARDLVRPFLQLAGRRPVRSNFRPVP